MSLCRPPEDRSSPRTTRPTTPAPGDPLPRRTRLREGDPSVLGEYDKHGRIRDGGTAEQAEAAASRAWLADTPADWMARDATGPQPATCGLSDRLGVAG